VTASGKSAAVHRVARSRGAGGVEVLSVDSMAVYRGMDVGTAKPSPAERREVRYHLVDLVEPGEVFTVVDFQQAAEQALDAVAGRAAVPLLVGGTALYLRAVIDRLRFPARFPEVAAELVASLEVAGPPGTGPRAARLLELHEHLARLDPAAAGRVNPANERRLVRALEVCLGSGRPFSATGPGLAEHPPVPYVLVGIRYDSEQAGRRIAERFDRQLADGFLEEVRALAAAPGGLSRTARQALGYRELLAHLRGDVTLDEARDVAVRRTVAFARRQWAWFRRDPRVVWAEDADAAAALAADVIDRITSGTAVDAARSAWVTRPAPVRAGPPCQTEPTHLSRPPERP
jgi:tRNA dimethylallyltransferase